jgi:hypothetical protein
MKTNNRWFLLTILVSVSIVSFLVVSARAQSLSKARPPKGVIQQLVRDDSDVGSLITDGTFTVDSLVNEIWAEKTDLNRDGKPEWVLQSSSKMGFCGATGNCALWIYSRDGTRYKQIAYADAVIGYTKKRTRSNGYLDIVFSQHSSAADTYLFTYKYIRGRYRSSGCVIKSYLDRNGNLSDRPRMLPCN